MATCYMVYHIYIVAYLHDISYQLSSILEMRDTRISFANKANGKTHSQQAVWKRERRIAPTFGAISFSRTNEQKPPFAA